MVYLADTQKYYAAQVDYNIHSVCLSIYVCVNQQELMQY